MSSTLTPLPSPRAGLSSATAKPTWNILPFPAAEKASAAPAKPASPLPEIPTPSAGGSPLFPSSWPAPMAALPASETSGGDWTSMGATTPPGAQPPPADPFDSPFTIEETSPPPPAAPLADATPDFTDDDLREAFVPIVEGAVRKAVYAKENGIDTYLEPMLRATIRRALAEHAPSSRPFHSPGTFDRFLWHMQALFTSRTYEEIVFEKTRRFQVEEVFLFDASSLALVSFASSDPARHTSVRRVSGSAQRLAAKLRDENGFFQPSFEITEQRRVVARQGTHVVLAAVVRGKPSELVHSDLDYALRRIEDLFREQFDNAGSALLHELQPFLEECLLIQAPATAA